MAVRTPSSYLGPRIITRGRATRRDLSGESTAARGYLSGYAEGDEPVIGATSPLAAISSSTVDSKGIAHLLDDDIQAIEFVEVNQSTFANPDREWTGYGANGFYYENGDLKPETIDPPFKASWAVEGEGDATQNRGELDRFPERIFIIATRKEVVILDADTLDVWIRFLLNTVVPPGNGPFLGGPLTKVRSVAFEEGILFVATNEGLRIALFYQDVGFRLTAPRPETVDVPALLKQPLVNRNDDDYLDGFSVANPNVDLLNSDCLDVSTEVRSIPDEASSTRNSFTVCAIGHSNGMSAFRVKFDQPLVVIQHPFVINYIAPWSALDDLDGTLTTPYFIDSGSLWAGDGVRAGDTLVTDLGTEHTIVEVDQIAAGNKLVLDPELVLGASGASYSISREVRTVLADKEVRLFFGNGRNLVTLVRSEDWFTTPGSVIVPGTLNTAHDTVGLAPQVERLNDLDLVVDLLYVACSLGVFSATDDQFSEGREAEFLYSTEAVTEAEANFKILEGEEKEVVAVAVDPETGNVAVAVTEIESVVTEINPNIQQAFRFFDSVGKVRDLVAYRNPNGPPDVEVS